MLDIPAGVPGLFYLILGLLVKKSCWIWMAAMNNYWQIGFRCGSLGPGWCPKAALVRSLVPLEKLQSGSVPLSITTLCFLSLWEHSDTDVALAAKSELSAGSTWVQRCCGKWCGYLGPLFCISSPGHDHVEGGVEEDLPNKCLMLLSLCNWGLVLLRPQWWGEKTQSVHWNAKCTDIAFQRDPMEGEKCCCSSSPTLLLPGDFESFSYNEVRMLGFRIIAVAWLPLLHPDTFRMEVQEVCAAADAFSVSCRLDPAQKPSPQVNCGQILSLQNHPETDHWRQQG